MTKQCGARPRHTAFDLGRRKFLSFNPNAMFSYTDICGLERVVLKNHRDVAVLG